MYLKQAGIKSKNIPLMYAIHIIGGLLFFLPIIALYLETHLFTITNVAIIFSTQAIAITLFEIPTGALADLFGRKKTIIIANISALIGFTFLYFGRNLYVFIIFAIFNAFAQSLTSGADQALIYDTLKEEKKEKHYKKIIGTYSALWPFGATAGSLIGGFLATISLSLPVVVSMLPIIIVLILTFFLKEPSYEQETDKNILKHAKESLKIVLSDYQLIILFIAGFLLWGLGESLHRLMSIFFTFKEIPLVYFGIITASIFALSSVGHYLAHSLSEKIGNKNTLLISTIGTPLFLLLATLSTKYTAAIFWAIPSIFFGLRNPIIYHLINAEAQSSKRATVLSTYNFFARLGLAICTPIIGYLADLYTINTAFKLSAIAMFIIPIIYLFLKEH